MSMTNINRVVLTGNLTTDPDLRETSTGLPVCKLRIASTARRKSSNGEDYEDRPNYINVTAWGSQGESAARFLSKGRQVAIDGRLEWREWEAQDGAKRQALDVVADSVEFLDSPEAGNDDEQQFELQFQDPVTRCPARRAPAQRRYKRSRTPVAA